VLAPLRGTELLADARAVGTHTWRGVARVPVAGAVEGGARSRVVRLVLRCAGLHTPSCGAALKAARSMAPWPARGTGQLALTGDAAFARDLRARAARMGLVLSEWGLWRADGARVGGESEADVLDELGLGWVEPTRRRFALLGLDEPKRPRGRPRIQPERDWSVEDL
jgi:DNA polymerase beta